MFFPERIRRIGANDRVLEVGPGSCPHPRSDVLLEKKFSDPSEAEAQRGYGPPLQTDKEIVYHDEPLRFDDLEVDPSGRIPAADPGSGEQPLDLDTVVAQHIKRVLGMTGGKIHGPGGAGELLKVNPNTLRYRMRKLRIPFGKDS